MLINRSILSMLERQYTSTQAKLLCHPDRLDAWKSGWYYPITLQLAPTDHCNLKCSFCSVKNRDGDVLKLDRIEKAVLDLKEMGLKAVEITGGGEPTLYSKINELIEFLWRIGLDIGLITNGIALDKNLPPTSLLRLQWIRISLNSLDYVPSIKVPAFRKTLGFSYVVHEGTTEATAVKIMDMVTKHQPAYLRLVPNCLSTDTIKQSYAKAREMGLTKLDHSFFQTKEYEVPRQCVIGYLKPFLAPDGYFYRCSANPLIGRKFNPEFRMGCWMDVNRIWQAPFRSMDTKHCQTGKCFFKEHNDFLESLRMTIPHPNFL